MKPIMPASSRPVTTVASADQRNQNSASGAITLLIAGFCSSGIFGIDGVCTKLKYQSSPIHITPEPMCSQRMKKGPVIFAAHPAEGAGGDEQDEDQNDARDDRAAQRLENHAHGCLLLIFCARGKKVYHD